MDEFRGDNIRETTATQAEVNRINELEDIEVFLQVIHEVAASSEDPESVRIAFIALTSTKLGSDYLKAKPIRL